MKPAVWRIFRNNKWNYADTPGGGIYDRAAWQPLYAAVPKSDEDCGTQQESKQPHQENGGDK
jgi:hypothetical protein